MSQQARPAPFPWHNPCRGLSLPLPPMNVLESPHEALWKNFINRIGKRIDTTLPMDPTIAKRRETWLCDLFGRNIYLQLQTWWLGDISFDVICPWWGNCPSWHPWQWFHSGCIDFLKCTPVRGACWLPCVQRSTCSYSQNHLLLIRMLVTWWLEPHQLSFLVGFEVHDPIIQVGPRSLQSMQSCKRENLWQLWSRLLICSAQSGLWISKRMFSPICSSNNSGIPPPPAQSPRGLCLRSEIGK